MNYNRLEIIGRLTKDPELRVTQAGKAVCSFTVAVDGERKDDPTLFVKVTAWERTAELAAEFLQKGQEVLVAGPAKLDSWEGNQGTRTDLAVTARELKFGRKAGEAGQQRDERPAKDQRSLSDIREQQHKQSQQQSWGENDGFTAEDIGMDDVPF